MNFFTLAKKTNYRAFSLIELLVVVAIIGIMTSIVLVSTNSSKNRKDVETAAFFVSSIVREAQTRALTGKQHTANTTPCSYRITWGGSQITSAYIYKVGGGSCGSSSTINSVTLPSGVMFSGSGSVDFVLPHGSVASAQVLTLQKGSVTQVVCIQTNGRIEPEASAGSC